MHPGMMWWWKNARRQACGGEGAYAGEGAGWQAGPWRAGDDFAGGAFGVRRPLRFLAHKLDLDDRQVAELARILDQDGYLADFEALPDGSFRVTEHNCAVLDVAERYGQACSSEIAFLRDVLPEARVERVSHMIAGAHSCSYVVTPEAT